MRTLALLSLTLTACSPADDPPRRARSGTDTAQDTDSETDDSAARDSATQDSAPPDDSGEEDSAPPQPLRVAVISDLNGSYGSTTYRDEVSDAVDAILADPPDLVLSTGDMVAGQRAGLDYAAMWAAFHATVSDRLADAGLPFAVTPGNHDASAYSGYGAERDAFEAAWADRRPDVTFVDDADYPFRYAFTVSDTLFVSLDDTLVGALASEQTEWLDRVLDTPAAARIVYGHVPLYPFSEEKASEALFDDGLEDMLVAHGVTAFVSGHHHTYYPGKRGALRLVGTACLGDGTRTLIGDDETSPRSVLRFTIDGGAITELEAFTGAAFDTKVERADLPASVGSGGDVIDRDDR